MNTVPLDEWERRSAILTARAVALQELADDDALPINNAARTTLRAVALICRSEASRIVRERNEL
jgi:DNA uptake protein ComE-like DNA-binding protein